MFQGACAEVIFIFIPKGENSSQLVNSYMDNIICMITQVNITIANTVETVAHVISSPEPAVADSSTSPSVADNSCEFVVQCLQLLYCSGVVVKGNCSYKLSELANLRSGDKGDTANIGVCVLCLCISVVPVHVSVVPLCVCMMVKNTFSSHIVFMDMYIMNLGVVARHPAIFPYLKSQLTAEVVQKYFYHLIEPSVQDTPCVARSDKSMLVF